MNYSLFRPFSPLSQGLLTRRFTPCFPARAFSSLSPSQQTPLNKAKADDLHHLEHGEEPKGLYNMPQDHSHHGDPRKFLNPDGTYTFPITPHTFHFEDVYSPVPKQQIVSVDGKKMIKGVEPRSLVELFCIHQVGAETLIPKP